MEYDIQIAMYNIKENVDFVLDKPQGMVRYVFIHFITPINIRQYNRIITTMPHACILYSPNEPCYYEATSFEMVHDYVCFLPVEEKYNPLNLGLPVNKLFYTDMGHKITKSLETINWLQCFKQDEKMSSELFNLLKMLAEEQHMYQKNNTYCESTEKFEQLRLLIYENPKNWDIIKMATYVNLSRSRFSVKYKSIFGVTAVGDLGNARMCLAKRLLSTTSLTCHNIAAECGYEGTSFFMRKFKSQTGVTPNKWRADITVDKPSNCSESSNNEKTNC